MSISFSGLGSGLDTSNWIQQLTALKQAKVTVLQKEREEVSLSRDTLSTIKSFFSAFRSSIERITDTRFNIATLDIFAQNLAKSANLNVFTASATTDAKEGIYNISVNQLASATSATSKYSYMTTIVETTTATFDSLLSNMGITDGTIIVKTKDGLERGLTIDSSDTMSSLIQKFKDIGVDAAFNASNGAFMIDLSKSDILDLGGTGIVDALHIEGVNEGYTSDPIQIQKVDTVYTVATRDTKLNAFSPVTGTQNITIQNSSDETYSFDITDTTTLGDFIDELNNRGLYANLEEDGTLEITGGKITGGSWDAITHLGLDSEPYTAFVTGNALTETIETFELVTLETRMVDDLGVKEGYLEVEDSEGDIQYLKIYSGQTIADLITDLAHMMRKPEFCQ